MLIFTFIGEGLHTKFKGLILNPIIIIPAFKKITQLLWPQTVPDYTVIFSAVFHVDRVPATHPALKSDQNQTS